MKTKLLPLLAKFILALFSILNIACPKIIFAQDSSIHAGKTGQLIYGITANAGQVVVHNPSVSNEKGTDVFGVSLQFGKQLINQSSFNMFSSLPVYGVEVSYNRFDKKLLGQTFAATYFIQPVFQLGKRLQFQCKGAAGLLLASNPADPVKNPHNQAYSSVLNSHLKVSAGLGYAISNKLLIQGNIGFYHFSNGGFKHPNLGVNWLNSSLSLIYAEHAASLPHLKKITDSVKKAWRPAVNIGVFYVPTQGYYIRWAGNRQYALGGFVELSKQVGVMNSFSLNAEAYENSIDTKRSKWKNNHSSVLAGVSFGHDFLLGRFVFNQQLGVYVTPFPGYYSLIYQRYGLTYNISKLVSAGLSCKVHREEADFVDFRAVFKL